ncbi:MAG: pilus assembly protein TadG-related protein [Rhodospirillales bacterium]
MTKLINRVLAAIKRGYSVTRLSGPVAGSLRRVMAEVMGLILCRRGATALFLGFATIPLFGFVGLAVDASRGYMVKSRLSHALDAAGLAGGRVFFSATRDADISMYFDVNFPPGYMDSTVVGPLIQAVNDDELLLLEARATIPTRFMHLFNIDTLTVSATAEVKRRTQIIEVVMAIDMSGSMTSSAGGGQSRIQAARSAATEMINILYGDNATKDLLKIGLVPWNAKVNVRQEGISYDSALTTSVTVPDFVNPLTGSVQSQLYYANNSPVPLLSAPPSNWRGCVFNRYLDNGIADDDADIHLYGYSSPTGDWQGWEPVGPEGEPVSGGTCSLSVTGGECTACLNRGITPLNNVKQTILDAVSDLTSPGGNTNIPQGLGWAWRVLKPGAPFDEAEVAPQFPRQQAIILLTDGENFGGNGDGYKAVFGTGSSAGTGMNPRLLSLATNIKASGVQIYTIQFANNGTALQTLMQSVATEPEAPFYQYAPDADALRDVFREVANNLSELRLSK